MLYNKIKSFTLSELILVVAIIWVLTLWMTAYMWNSWERAKIIEAQWCANAIWWELKNYVYNALTSKNLKSGDNYVSPEYYFISLINSTSPDTKPWCKNENEYCYDIALSYAFEKEPNPVIQRKKNIQYKIINNKNICHKEKIKLRYIFTWWGPIAEASYIYHIFMNKWFTPRKVNEKKVFFMPKWNYWYENGLFEETRLLTWDIIAMLCYNKGCDSWKDIGRFHIDARSQTIEFQKCKFYKEEEPTRCKTREWETDDEV